MSGDINALIAEFFVALRRHEGEDGQDPAAAELGFDDYRLVESRLPVSLPPTFKLWHRHVSSDDVVVGGLELPGSGPGHRLTKLERVIFESGISDEAISAHLIPFGWDEDAGMFLCFDGRATQRGAEWPILGLNHELHFEEALRLADQTGPIAASFAEFLQDCIVTLNKLTRWSERFQ